MSAEPGLPAATADPAELARLGDELGVAREMPGPSLATWIAETSETFGSWLASLLVDRLGMVSELAAVVVRFTLGALFVLLLSLAVVYLWRWRQRRLGAAGTVETRDSSPTPLVERPDSVATWAEILARRLGAGDAVAAAEALWWWLASRLDAHAEPSWTSRELIMRAGRRDLAPSVRRLDWMLYGPWQPDTGEVETLWHELDGQTMSGPTGRGPAGSGPTGRGPTGGTA